jgi:hypothetical protein
MRTAFARRRICRESGHSTVPNTLTVPTGINIDILSALAVDLPAGVALPSVPEPQTHALMLAGLAGLGWVARCSPGPTPCFPF